MATKKKIQKSKGSYIFLQILFGIEAIHRVGLIHRDIKPSNILIKRKGKWEIKIKIIDLELSCDCNSEDEIKQKCGTREYMSPEVLSGKGALKVSDIWASGVVLFYMITGVLPYKEGFRKNHYPQAVIWGNNNQASSLILGEYVDTLGVYQKGLLCEDPEKRIAIDKIKKHKFITQNKFHFNNFNLK
ncbi:MAG: serine/threonine-protein kinase [bacterium]|nr:serine/threonine-protein kinase [bacterium]